MTKKNNNGFAKWALKGAIMLIVGIVGTVLKIHDYQIDANAKECREEQAEIRQSIHQAIVEQKEEDIKVQEQMTDLKIATNRILQMVEYLKKDVERNRRDTLRERERELLGDP